ncbi:MAG: hypothetical protein FWD52_09435 [Candidatus Bathyarchaeota archaeon]|nr:hypothetical protein [Candidatus Termiticorpusculum sp.]
MRSAKITFGIIANHLYWFAKLVAGERSAVKVACSCSERGIWKRIRKSTSLGAYSTKKIVVVSVQLV